MPRRTLGGGIIFGVEDYCERKIKRAGPEGEVGEGEETSGPAFFMTANRQNSVLNSILLPS